MDEQRALEIGARIKKLRVRSPYTQSALADKLNITGRQYQRYEKEGAPYRQLETLAKIHKVPVDYLLNGEDAEAVEAPESQLDRIEDKLDELLTLLSGGEHAAPPLSGELGQMPEDVPATTERPRRSATR